MIYIPNSNHEAAMNLAMEEYLLTSSGIREPILFFYINNPSIIIGRHQNAADEINGDYVRQNGIQVVRRCSGGGAVYHDLGNLNYSLITPGAQNASADFSLLLIPILSALHHLGLPAKLTGRNDLTLNGAKFSGNAYYHNRYGSVVHGTILFDSDLDVLSKALLPDPEKLSGKGIPSVRSRVCCIKQSLCGISNTEELKEAIIGYFQKEGELRTLECSDSDREQASTLAASRYRNDTWTYGESPFWNIRHRFRTTNGRIDFRADIQNGIVCNARFFGDFFCSGEISDLEAVLKDVLWQQEELTKTLHRGNWQRFFPDLPAEIFSKEIFSRKADE